MSTALVPGSLAAHTSCVLLKLGQVAFRLAEDRLGGLGLRVRHYSILQGLVDTGGMAQLELGAYLGIDPATMVTALDNLEQKGLAARTRDPRDRRRYLIAITEKGRHAVTEANRVLEALDDDAFADLGAIQRRHLHETLTTLSESPAFMTDTDQLSAYRSSRETR